MTRLALGKRRIEFSCQKAEKDILPQNQNQEHTVSPDVVRDRSIT
jgi:hypothetical protein